MFQPVTFGVLFDMAQDDKKVSIILFVLLALIWGSSFILMKRAILSFTPVQVGAMRIVFAGGFTALIGFKSFKLLNQKDLFPLIVVGWLGNGIPYILFPIAVQWIDSSIVGVINSLVPIFTLIIGFIWFRFQPKWNQLAGIFLGFTGAFFLIKPEGSFELQGQVGYALLAVIATLCYAISINTINSKLKHLNAMAITNLSLLTVAPFMLIYILTTDFTERFSIHPLAWENLGYIAILGIIGSSVAIILFNHLIKISSPIFSSSVTYAIPIVAIIWGLIDGEPIGLRHLAGVGGILFGIWLVNLSKKASAKG